MQTCGGARRFRPVSQSHQRMGNVAAATAAQSSRSLVTGPSSLPLLLASPPTIPASGYLSAACHRDMQLPSPLQPVSHPLLG